MHPWLDNTMAGMLSDCAVHKWTQLQARNPSLTMLYIAGVHCIIDNLELIQLIITYFHHNIVDACSRAEKSPWCEVRQHRQRALCTRHLRLTVNAAVTKVPGGWWESLYSTQLCELPVRW
eukprot:GHUV01032948.1.p2 GENE.GHUV01032948.1~~GHUV01032948.1.p2  ORF type:complete len:120 (-),score=18.20 GHUV01032948.1:301-660(-)